MCYQNYDALKIGFEEEYLSNEEMKLLNQISEIMNNDNKRCRSIVRNDFYSWEEIYRIMKCNMKLEV